MNGNEKLQLLIGQQVFKIFALEDQLTQAQATISELQQLVDAAAQPDRPPAEAQEGQGEGANA